MLCGMGEYWYLSRTQIRSDQQMDRLMTDNHADGLSDKLTKRLITGEKDRKMDRKRGQ